MSLISGNKKITFCYLKLKLKKVQTFSLEINYIVLLSGVLGIVPLFLISRDMLGYRLKLQGLKQYPQEAMSTILGSMEDSKQKTKKGDLIMPESIKTIPDWMIYNDEQTLAILKELFDEGLVPTSE